MMDNYWYIVYGDKLVLNNSNEYGITDDNKDTVDIWLKSLCTDTRKPNLVVLPWKLDDIGTFDNNWIFTISSGFESDWKITIWGVEYSKISGEAGGLWYKIDQKTVVEGESSRDEDVFLLWKFENGKLNWKWTKFFVNGKLEWDFANNEPKTGWNFAFTWNKSWNVLKYSKTEGENSPRSWTVTLTDNTILNVSRNSVEDDWVVSDGSSDVRKFSRLSWEEIKS